jgi:hypothetical protein
MNIGPQVWLESNSFLPIGGEEDETNPGVFGKAYAHWLADELRRSGEPVADIFGEDWGWCVMLRYKPYRLFIACSSGEGEHPSEPTLSEWAPPCQAPLRPLLL